jgi:hypothetical protein
LDDRQTDPEPRRHRVEPMRSTFELLPDGGLETGGNALAVVVDFEDEVASDDLCNDQATVTAISDGVVDQIAQCLLHTVGIDVNLH